MALIIKLNQNLLDLRSPKVMGVININENSFYENSRANSENNLLKLTEKHLKEGADIIDIGAMSSRPGALISKPEDEAKQIQSALKSITKHFDCYISVDTVHSFVAQLAYDYGGHMINDISAGCIDQKMFTTMGQLKIPYIAMHMQGTPENMQSNPVYENVAYDVLQYFSKIMHNFKQAGGEDIIIDPGFGFGKTIEHNYKLLSQLALFKILDRPILVGLSRKSMIYKVLTTTPDEALNGTTVLNTIALLKGANILRVHDVKEAKECIKLVNQIPTKTESFEKSIDLS
jgi:dihydropteroate synthase